MELKEVVVITYRIYLCGSDKYEDEVFVGATWEDCLSAAKVKYGELSRYMIRKVQRGFTA